MWRKDYPQVRQAILKMRQARNADVDKMGAEAVLQSKKLIGEKNYRFQALVSVMLSSMTKDPATAAAVKRLQDLPEGLTIDSILKTPEKDLAQVLRGVGFHNRKAIYLRETAAILKEKYQGDVPDELEKLLELPGVGSKMAKIALAVGHDKIVGIAADTHVHRISNRLGWVKTKSPLDTEKELEDWIPREHWADINVLLVGLGQQICLPRNPKCSECLAKNLCPKIGVKSSTTSRKK
jgi:endonuclease III